MVFENAEEQKPELIQNTWSGLRDLYARTSSRTSAERALLSLRLINRPRPDPAEIALIHTVSNPLRKTAMYGDNGYKPFSNAHFMFLL